jgi:hypothetical protein
MKIILVVLLGALVVWIIRLSRPKEDVPLNTVRLTPTMIYCWQCMGNDELGARATQLTTAGRCCECSGLAWTPASRLAPKIAAAEAARHGRSLEWN